MVAKKRYGSGRLRRARLLYSGLGEVEHSETAAAKSGRSAIPNAGPPSLLDLAFGRKTDRSYDGEK